MIKEYIDRIINMEIKSLKILVFFSFVFDNKVDFEFSLFANKFAFELFAFANKLSFEFSEFKILLFDLFIFYLLYKPMTDPAIHIMLPA